MALAYGDEMYSIKAEKADAMRKFNQQQSLLYFGRLLGASVLLLWSFKTLPFLTQMASVYVSVFGQQLCAFLVANAIVIFVYHFSTAAANNTIASADKDLVTLSSSSPPSPSAAPSSAASFRSDIYDEYVSLSSADRRRRPVLDGGGVLEEEPADILLPEVNSAGELVTAEEDRVAAEEGFSDGTAGRRHRRTRSVVEETTRTRTKSFGDENSDGRYRRDESNNMSEWKELRRSETVVMKTRKSTAAAAAELGKSLSFNQARKSIEEMNNDEFNMTVESFIATKKKLLRDENIALFETDFDGRQMSAVACPR